MIRSILLTAGVALVLFASGFFSLLTPLPFGFCLARRGGRAAAAALLIAAAALFFLYRLLPWPILPFRAFIGVGLIYFVYFAAMGLALAHAGRSAFTYERGLALVIGIAVAVALVPALIQVAVTGVNPIEVARAGLEGAFSEAARVGEQRGLSGDELLVLKSSVPALAGKITSLLPAAFLCLTFVSASLNLIFLRRWLALSGLFVGWPEFSSWRLAESWIWVPIATGILYFANLYLIRQPWLEAVVLNVALGLAVLYLYQGLSVLSHFLKKRLSPSLRLLAYLAILLFLQPFAILLVLFGLFDFWFDFRKLKRVG